MSATAELQRETEAARALLATYQDILGDDEAKDIAVEGETNLHDAIRFALARIVELRALVAANERIQDDLRARLKRFGDQEDRIRAALLAAMEVRGWQRYETSLGSVSRKAVPPSLVVTDEAAIPEDFKVPQPPKLDRRKLLDALKSGDPAYADIPGAELSNGGATVTIRMT